MSKRMLRKHVAEIARAVMPPEEQLRWFALVGQGIDPEWKPSIEGEKQPPISLEQKFGARRLLAAYAFGMPSQSVLVEANLRAVVAHAEIGTGPKTFEAVLPADELEAAREAARAEVAALRARVGRMLAERGESTPDESVEDAEFTEAP